MKKAMNKLTIFTGLTFILFTTLYFYYRQDWMMVCAISLGTTFYHFIIRLMIGSITHYTQSVKYNVEKGWFKTNTLEIRFYEFIGVKFWKEKMPTYSPESFSLEHCSLDEIIHNMCDSEIVHEMNFIASYIPLLFSRVFGEFYVFFITSLLASLFDLSFVFIQRYNRPRVIALNNKRKTRKNSFIHK